MHWSNEIVFGLGHVLNDICASMWFTYLLVFFHLVLGFGASQAGILMLVGQVADALATPFVGYYSDTSSRNLMRGYGRRKTWHLFGTICVLISFPYIFSPCIECKNAHYWAQMIYYSSFIVIFQIGWAAVQVSHLSLIPELSSNEHDRTRLTAVRYTFTVFSNLAVYIITWLVLHLLVDGDKQIGPSDEDKFLKVVGIGIGIGILTSIIFHVILKEPTAPEIESLITSSSLRLLPQVSSHRSMLKRFSFYQVGLVYMGTRLFVNLVQILTPLYLHQTLKLSASSLASVPLVMLLGSFVASFIVRPLNRICGRKIAYTFGAILGVAGCLWLFFGSGDLYASYFIYVVAILLGVGGAIMLVTSLGLTADLIENATDTAAFVYGAMSFTDKLANGVAIVVIQYLSEEYDKDFYRWTLACGCGVAAIFSTLSVYLTKSNSRLHREDFSEERRLRLAAERELRAALQTSASLRRELSDARAAEYLARRDASEARANAAKIARHLHGGGRMSSSSANTSTEDDSYSKRGMPDDNLVARLRLQINQLKDELATTQTELEQLKNSRRNISRSLTQATNSAESSLRELLSGLDQLRGLASSLDPP